MGLQLACHYRGGTHFTGTPAYGVRQLHHDLDRFTFLLGGNDGEPLFDPDPQQQRPRPNAEDI